MADKTAVEALLKQVKDLTAAGATMHDHPEHDRRDQLLDELQDAVGLSQKMVTENDILKRAEKVLAGA